MQRPRTYPRFSFAVLVASCWVGGTFAPHCCAFQYAVEYQQYYHDHHASPQQQQRKRLLATTTAPIAFALKIPRPSSDRTITAVVPRGGDYSSPATRKAVGVACASDYGWGYYGTHHGGNTNNGMGFMFSVEMAAKGNKGKTTKNAKKGGRRAGGGSGEKVGSGSGGFGAAPPARLAATTTTTTTAAPTRAGADASVTSAAKTTGMETARVAPKATERRSPNPQQQVELPDDDFATFPPLSLATLESVMGLDVFELPAGGVAARERGQQVALPFQVLECIRDRHGMPEFGGGRQLLDDAYIAHDEGERPAAAVGGGQGESGEADERDRPRTSPLLLFPGLRLLHAEPPVIGVDDFFTSEECNAYVSKSLSPAPDPASVPHAAGKSTTAGPHMQRSATLGADVDSVAQRTSTTWFHRYSAVPELMAKASALVGIPFDEERWEEPQTVRRVSWQGPWVRYRPGEKFTWHLDALPPTPDLATKGGQRIVTLLVYLTDMPEGDGGATAFRDLGPLRVRPRKGSALLFFPACGGAPDCPFDVRTLHAGERRLFQTIRNKGEGDCGPASLWQLLYGGQPTSRDLKEMRNQAVDEVYRNPSSYLGFFEGETEGARKGMLYRWTVNMSKKGVWADQLFINAVARAHQVNVRILVPNGNDTLRDEQGNYAGQGTAWRTYYMLHTGGCHFEALKILGKVMPIGCGAEQKSAEASTASTVESSSRVPPPLPPKPKPKPVEKVKKYRVY